MFSESIKTIRTNLAFSSIKNDMKVILMTSPEPGDGKSFISANLAVAYAQEGKKVLNINSEKEKDDNIGKYKNKNQELESEYSKKEISYLEQKD